MSSLSKLNLEENLPLFIENIAREQRCTITQQLNTPQGYPGISALLSIKNPECINKIPSQTNYCWSSSQCALYATTTPFENKSLVAGSQDGRWLDLVLLWVLYWRQ